LGNDVAVEASRVFKTPGVLTTVNGVQVAELLSASDNVALDKIPSDNALSLPSLDERGTQRPQMTAIDAGAYELSPVALTKAEPQGGDYMEAYTSENYSVLLQPEDATLNVRAYKEGLSWSVSDPAVLSVDQQGRVSALALGTASLNVAAHGWDAGGNAIVRESSKVIEVGPVALVPPAITVSAAEKRTQMSVEDQYTLRLDVKVLPEETPYTVAFTSTNPSIAAVTQPHSASTSAVIKALSPGETMISATVTAKNSKGTTVESDSYLLTVVERQSSSGGGCQRIVPEAFTGLVLAGFPFLWRSRSYRKNRKKSRQP
jgi:hypothetical protein